MVALGSGIIWYGISLPFFNNATGRGYTGFFLGMILFYLYEKTEENHRLKIFTFVYSFILTIAILFCLAFDVLIDSQQGIFLFMLWPAVLFLFLNFEKLFKNGKSGFCWWSIFGSLSFEMYVWHSPFLLLYKLGRKAFGFSAACTRMDMFLFTLWMIVFSFFMCKAVEPLLNNFVKKVTAFFSAQET